MEEGEHFLYTKHVLYLPTWNRILRPKHGGAMSYLIADSPMLRSCRAQEEAQDQNTTAAVGLTAGCGIAASYSQFAIRQSICEELSRCLFGH